MVRRQRRGRNRCRPPVKRLGITEASSFLRDDREVVQRVGEVGMERTQLSFLNAGGLSEQFACRREVAIRGGAFRDSEDLFNITGFRHRTRPIARSLVVPESLYGGSATKNVEQSGNRVIW